MTDAEKLERKRARDRAYYRAHKEQKQAYNKQYYQKNKERMDRQNKEWEKTIGRNALPMPDNIAKG